MFVESKEEELMRTVMYIRVSKQEQNTELQKEALDKYVLNSKYQIVGTYVDIISGSKSSRPELDRLMIDARDKKFEHVIFWKVDRLGRSTLHMLQVVEEWQKLGITFSITTLNIDTNTPMGKFVFGLLSQVAELERTLIIERTNLAIGSIQNKLKQGKGHKAKSGRVIHSLGRPKGSKDRRPRSKAGYYHRWYEEKNK